MVKLNCPERESVIYFLNHAMICVNPSKVTPNRKFPHSGVHCLHQRINMVATSRPPNVSRLTRARWRRSIPFGSCLAARNCIFDRSSVMSQANNAKIAPLNIQPIGKPNHKPIIANDRERNKPTGDTHLQPRHGEMSHTAPKAIIQRGMTTSPMFAYPQASEPILMIMLDTSANPVKATSTTFAKFYHWRINRMIYCRMKRMKDRG